MPASVVVTCLVAYAVSNTRYRDQLAKEFILKPFTSRSLNPPRTERAGADAPSTAGAGKDLDSK
jgi:hypothetical protein